MDQRKAFIRNRLKEDDLSPEQRGLFRLLGRDRYLDLCEELGRTAVSVAKLETLRRSIARRKIQENKKLYKSLKISKAQLAAMYGFSAKTVYNILNSADKRHE